ncbi:hypothetical protein N431DRAFT_531446 [Stipitochalara longipes BDJ]|nr:hypothetical protein N431DRAFT_531446 [Stipitochalara longipes BDJ]
MAEEKDEPWDVKTALRRSLHIIHIHALRKPAEHSKDGNIAPVPNIPQDMPKQENAPENHGRIFKANPFDDRSEGVVYQVEPLDERLLDSFPSPPTHRTRRTRRKYLFSFMLAAFVFVASIAIGLAVGLPRKQASNPAPCPGLVVSGFFSPDETTFHSIFYVLNSQIVLANMTCPASTPTSCSTLTNTVISNSLQHTVAADSSTAAVFLGFGANKTFRISYHNTNHEVTELPLMNETQQETVISAAVVQGSSLAAAIFSAPGYIQVVYMDAKANTIFTIENFNGNWLPPTPITAFTIPSLSPTTSLALSYAFVPDSLFLFFTTTLSAISHFTAHNVSQSTFPAAISSTKLAEQYQGGPTRQIVTMSGQGGWDLVDRLLIRGGLIKRGSSSWKAVTPGRGKWCRVHLTH